MSIGFERYVSNELMMQPFTTSLGSQTHSYVCVSQNIQMSYTIDM